MGPIDSVKNLTAKKSGRCRFDTWVGKFPCKREWQPTPVFLPGESHGQGEPGGLQSMGSQRVGHNWATNTHTEQMGASNQLYFGSFMAGWRMRWCFPPWIGCGGLVIPQCNISTCCLLAKGMFFPYILNAWMLADLGAGRDSWGCLNVILGFHPLVKVHQWRPVSLSSS